MRKSMPKLTNKNLKMIMIPKICLLSNYILGSALEPTKAETSKAIRNLKNF